MKTQDSDLFYIYNIQFHELLAFIGQDRIHWVFYIQKPLNRLANNRRVYALMKGFTPLTLNYCSCCFEQQYMKFVDSILFDLPYLMLSYHNLKDFPELNRI